MTDRHRIRGVLALPALAGFGVLLFWGLSGLPPFGHYHGQYGYLINNLIPATWVTALFGSGQTWGVALAATFGLPLYVNSDASLPLVKSFLDSGANCPG